VGFLYGFLVPTTVVLLGEALFMTGWNSFVKIPPAGSVIIASGRVVLYAIRAPWEHRMNAESFLDRAKSAVNHSGDRLFTDEQVDSVKQFWKLLPLLTAFIVFWCPDPFLLSCPRTVCNSVTLLRTLKAQMETVFYTQAMGLNLYVLGSLAPIFPISALQFFYVGALLLFVPLIGAGLLPWLRSCGVNLSALKRIGIGMLLVSLAMGYAGGLEVMRIRYYAEGYRTWHVIQGMNCTAVDISVLWQAPSYALIGVGEALAAEAGFEFAYRMAPTTMRSLVLAIMYLFESVGCWGAAVLVWIMDMSVMPPMFTEDPTESHAPYYFFGLGIVGLLNLALFAVFAWRFTPVTRRPLRYVQADDGEQPEEH